MKKCLITGGMGFIGFNSALHFSKKGFEVTVLDNLSRNTSKRNYSEFNKLNVQGIKFVKGDIRDYARLQKIFRKGSFDLVLHLAGQVAVTTSVLEPRKDFEINAIGTFNVLEAMRTSGCKGLLVYASTNKVYGGMDWVKFTQGDKRYSLKSPKFGLSENSLLDFHSPYGCSKGAADQYVRDYSRMYGLKTVVFRQSCIYGPWQYGEEDQGWVAWFLIAALSKKPIKIYGNGKQVRDVLHVNDLVSLYEKAWRKRNIVSGSIFNVGGGIENTLSLLELLEWMSAAKKLHPSKEFEGWRPGDQKIYVSDTRKVKKVLEWEPRMTVSQGLSNIYAWLSPRFMK